MNRTSVSSVIHREFFGAMIVMTAVELANAVCSLVDGAMAARLLGPTELAAYGIASPYFSVAAVVSGILMVGCQTACARSAGAGRTDEACQLFSMCCILAMILGGTLAVLGVLFSGPFAMLLGARGASAELLPYAKSYLTGLFLGTPMNVLMVVISPIVQLDGDGKRATLCSLTVAAVDIVADILFTGVLKMGLFGLGLASSVSYLFALAVLLTHFLKKDRLFRFRMKDLQWSLAPQAVSIGLPRGATQICRTIGPILVNGMVMAAAATAGLSALAVKNNLMTLLRSPIMGIGGAVMLMSGIYGGEQDVDGLKKTLSVAMRYILLAVGAITVLVIAAAPLIAGFYLPDSPQARDMAVSALRWFALSLPVMALNLCAGNYLTAIGNRPGAYLINIGNELVSLVACVFVLSRLLGIYGVWVAFTVHQLLTLVIFVLWGMLRPGTQATGLDRLLFLPKGFGVPEEDCISVSLTSLEQVVGLYQKIGAFCHHHGVDRRRSYLAALCLEEMAGNTVEYGFADGKRHSIDVRVILRGEDVLLRLRDDCQRFDLKEKVKSWTLDPEHPEENVGIRMVLALSKDVTYTNTMNMNNLLITI